MLIQHNILFSGGSVAQLVESRDSNRKVAKPWFDFQCGRALLCPPERHLMLFPILRPISLPVEVAQSGERHANRTASVYEWYDRHRPYRTKSGSNEKEELSSVFDFRFSSCSMFLYLLIAFAFYILVQPWR